MRTLPLALSALALAAPAPSTAAAQDGSEAAEKRTVESAQEFLGKFYGNGGARIETGGYRSGSLWKWEKFAGSESVSIDARVESLRISGRCKSVISMSAPTTKRWRADAPSEPLDIAADKLDLLVDWSKVTRVKADPGWMFEAGGTTEVPSGWHRAMIYWPGGGSAFFMHLDKADAERAAFAMQFLKEKCAPQNDTGF